MLSDSEIGDLLVNYWKVEGKRGLLGKYARELIERNSDNKTLYGKIGDEIWSRIESIENKDVRHAVMVIADAFRTLEKNANSDDGSETISW